MAILRRKGQREGLAEVGKGTEGEAGIVGKGAEGGASRSRERGRGEAGIVGKGGAGRSRERGLGRDGLLGLMWCVLCEGVDVPGVGAVQAGGAHSYLFHVGRQ